jgi:mannose-6-phosphate isomerase-like protein (cupin superfamily)
VDQLNGGRPPGAAQALHRHDFEQVYIVVAGQGRMQIGGEGRDVAAGDFVHVPPDAPHGVTTTGDQVLSYISASTPAYRESTLDDEGNV